MIGLLTVLTIVYAAILVVVLAASLITIAVILWRIGSTLGEIAGGVKLVERQTAPLGGYLGALNEGLGGISERLISATDHLAATDDQLAALAGEPAGARKPARVA